MQEIQKRQATIFGDPVAWAESKPEDERKLGSGVYSAGLNTEKCKVASQKSRDWQRTAPSHESAEQTASKLHSDTWRYVRSVIRLEVHDQLIADRTDRIEELYEELAVLSDQRGDGYDSELEERIRGRLVELREFQEREAYDVVRLIDSRLRLPLNAADIIDTINGLLETNEDPGRQ